MPHVLVNGPASWNMLVDVPALPTVGSPTMFASGHREGLGGTSAGKAVTLAALEVEVVLRTVLGDDTPGERVRAALARPHLRLLVEPARSGRTERHLNLMTAEGERQSIYLELPQPAQDLDPAAAAALLVGVDVLVADLADHSHPLLDAARDSGASVWCDVHDDDGRREYARAFADAADVLLVSAARLADPAGYLRARVGAGCRLAVCTFGAGGALALDATGWFDVGAAPVDRVVDTNGAGDAFFAGLLSAMLDGSDTAEALAFAAATAALAVGSADLGAPEADRAAVTALARSVRVVRRPV